MNFLKISSAALLVAAAIVVPRASATCSNASVNGVWGYAVGAAVGQFTTNGAGKLTGAQTVSNKGVITKQTYTGNYSVAANCTGKLALSFTGGGTATVNIVLDSSNTGAQAIDTDNGSVASGFSLAQGTVTCGLTGIKQTFAANLFGKNSVGHVAYVAQVILNGTGGASGTGTFDVNGTIKTATFTGTYTENSHCTGTLKITPSGLSALNFNFVVVSAGKEIFLIETDVNTAVLGYMQQ